MQCSIECKVLNKQCAVYIVQCSVGLEYLFKLYFVFTSLLSHAAVNFKQFILNIGSCIVIVFR